MSDLWGLLANTCSQGFLSAQCSIIRTPGDPKNFPDAEVLSLHSFFETFFLLFLAWKSMQALSEVSD